MPKERAREEAFRRKENQQRLFKLPSEIRQISKKNDKKTSETRKYERFKPRDAKIKVVKSGILSKLGIKKNVGSNILDLSEGGARIRTSSMMSKGAKIFLHLALPKFQDFVDAHGEVRWVKKHSEEEFEIGVMFTSIDEKQKNKINFMRRHFESKG